MEELNAERQNLKKKETEHIVILFPSFIEYNL